MSKNKKNVPQIRFPGFTDPWEQRRLGEVAKSYSGGTPSVGKDEYYNGDIPFIRSAEINDDSTELFISETGLNNSSAKMVEVGDILYALYGATSGEVGISRINGAINQAILAIQPEEDYDSQFIMQWLRNQKQKIIDKYLQGGQGNLSGSIVKDLLIEFPSYNEQARIGGFFQKLDHLITLHQRKLNNVKNLKAGLLQKMFPKNGENFPEVRFPEFTDSWEQQRLGEIFNILDGDRGKNYPGEADFFESGATLFLDTGNVKKSGFEFSTKKYITKEKDESLRSGKLKLYDFVLTSRGTLGNVAYYDEITLKNHPSVRINSAMLILRPAMHGEVSDDYMASVLRGNIINDFMSKNHVGSAQPHITKRDFSKVDIGIPSTIEEQEKIGSFFKNFDTLITLHQRKLEHLQKQKKALLQQMFV